MKQNWYGQVKLVIQKISERYAPSAILWLLLVIWSSCLDAQSSLQELGEQHNHQQPLFHLFGKTTLTVNELNTNGGQIAHALRVKTFGEQSEWFVKITPEANIQREGQTEEYEWLLKSSPKISEFSADNINFVLPKVGGRYRYNETDYLLVAYEFIQFPSLRDLALTYNRANPWQWYHLIFNQSDPNSFPEGRHVLNAFQRFGEVSAALNFGLKPQTRSFISLINHPVYLIVDDRHPGNVMYDRATEGFYLLDLNVRSEHLRTDMTIGKQLTDTFQSWMRILPVDGCLADCMQHIYRAFRQGYYFHLREVSTEHQINILFKDSWERALKRCRGEQRICHPIILDDIVY